MGQGNLATVGDVVRAVDASRIRDISDALMAVLKDSALPSAVEGMFYTDPSVMLAPVEVHGLTHLTLGANEEDIAGRYLLSEAGEVFIQGPEGDELRFVNARLDHFFAFMSAWNGFVSNPAPVDSSGDVDEDAVIEEGMRLKESLERVDGAAFSDEETWWSNVFDEVELGVLGPL
ncbi:SUKH-4 family immunity protein [Streptomyces sp. NPDC052016]|uniref:SUKH-4 family immunity protein n=1 Tax=Streptomyces sp. NPDC052016 TaxID=3365680 RepID=UPI0037D60B8A